MCHPTHPGCIPRLCAPCSCGAVATPLIPVRSVSKHTHTPDPDCSIMIPSHNLRIQLSLALVPDCDPGGVLWGMN